MAKKAKAKLNTAEKDRLRLQKKLRKISDRYLITLDLLFCPKKILDVEINSQKSDFDNIFIFDNLVVIAEDTTAAANKNDHLRKKAEFSKNCQDNKTALIQFLKTIPAFKNSSAVQYSDADIQFSFLYVSLNEIDATHQKQYKSTLTFIDQKMLSYFLSLSDQRSKNATKSEIF